MANEPITLQVPTWLMKVFTSLVVVAIVGFSTWLTSMHNQVNAIQERQGTVETNVKVHSDKFLELREDIKDFRKTVTSQLGEVKIEVRRVDSKVDRLLEKKAE